jgi:superfamily II DNA/RNA helicase
MNGLKEWQKLAIAAAMNKGNVMIVIRSGSGKTTIKKGRQK